jgi:hypothetical protein
MKKMKDLSCSNDERGGEAFFFKQKQQLVVDMFLSETDVPGCVDKQNFRKCVVEKVV